MRSAIVVALAVAVLAGGAIGLPDGVDGRKAFGHPSVMPSAWEQLNDTGDHAGVRRTFAKVVAACMRRHGWGYEPWVGNRPVELSSRPDLTERWGLGISTAVGAEDALQDDLGASPDPNAAIRASLDDGQRERYDDDLDGDMTTAAPGGCRRDAVVAVLGPDSPLLDEETVVAFGALQDEIVGDPRLAGAWQAWSRCMAASGHPATTPAHLSATYADRLDAIGVAVPGSDVLLDLQRSEIAAAQAAHRCSEDHVAGVEARVRTEAEARFRARYGV